MKRAFLLRQPMQSIFWTNHAYRILYYVMLIIAGAGFLAIASQVAIPMRPVPMTLQTFAVMFIAMTYGWRLGFGSVLIYLLLGAAGVGVFSGLSSGADIVYTSGYLFGFLPAVLLGGFLVQRGWGRNAFTVGLATLLGFVIIFAFGLLVLSFYIGWKAALISGLLPFLPGEAVKLLVLSVIVPFFWKKEKKA